jgi:hypothetical protein
VPRPTREVDHPEINLLFSAVCVHPTTLACWNDK